MEKASKHKDEATSRDVFSPHEGTSDVYVSRVCVLAEDGRLKANLHTRLVCILTLL